MVVKADATLQFVGLVQWPVEAEDQPMVVAMELERCYSKHYFILNVSIFVLDHRIGAIIAH